MYIQVDVVRVFTLVQLPPHSCSVQRKWRLFRSGNLKAEKVAPSTCRPSLEPLPSCDNGRMAGKMSSSIGQPHSSIRRCEVSPVPSCATQSVTRIPNPAETHDIQSAGIHEERYSDSGQNLSHYRPGQALRVTGG